MCGLTLVVNRYKNGFNQQQLDIFSSLMYLSGGFRGRDGAGVVVVDNLGNVKLAKDVGSVDNFQQEKEYHELDRAAFQNGWAMVGHNRSATRGVVSDTNAHPFVIDDKIVLVHNGTFHSNHKQIRDTEVDSEVIGHILSENENVEEALRKVNAAYALIWYNVDKKEVYVIRNSQRPLWFMEIGSSFIFSSESSFLQFVMDKFSLKPTTGPFLTKESSLSTFSLQDDGGTLFECKDLDVSYHKHNQPPPFRQPPDHTDLYGGCFSPHNRATSTYDVEIVSKVLQVMGGKITPMSNKQWADLVSTKRYSSEKRIKVIVEEVVEASDEPNNSDYVFIGKTVDGSDIPTVFLMRDIGLAAALEHAAHSLFEIESLGLYWKRWESLFPVDMKQPLEDWEGVVMVHGKNAIPVHINDEVSVG